MSTLNFNIKNQISRCLFIVCVVSTKGQVKSFLSHMLCQELKIKNTLVKGRTLTGEPRAWVFTSRKYGEAYLYVFSRIVQVCSINRHNCKCASVSFPQEMTAAWSTGGRG